jgi:3-dehydroquinate synthase
LSAGIAEVIKYGLICDADFYQWLEANVDQLMQRKSAALSEAIYRSCVNKAKVVALDEHEAGIRAILNLGHTFGHAIETAQGYGNWLHGEAVAAGTVLAAELSMQQGWLSSNDLQGVIALLKRAKLPVSPPAMTANQFLDLMAVDKKVLDGRLRLVLLKQIGEALVTSEITEQSVRAALAAQGVH